MTHRNSPAPRRRRSTPGGSNPTLPIKLHLLIDAPDPDGLPRAALEIIPAFGPRQRPVWLLFGSIATALAAKQRMEAGQ